MPRSPCLCISTQTWVAHYWNHCFDTNIRRILPCRMPSVTQVRHIYPAPSMSSRACHQGPYIQTHHSTMLPIFKVSSVGQIITAASMCSEYYHLETANMLIMIYAHNRASGNGTLIETYVCPSPSYLNLVT
jgi:hypothetical protein